MEVYEINQKLEILEECINYPLLLLIDHNLQKRPIKDDLFSDPFFYNATTINGKNLIDSLIEYLQHQEVFRKTTITNVGSYLLVRFDDIVKDTYFSDIYCDDRLLTIDLYNCTYKFYNYYEKDCKAWSEKDLTTELNPIELDDFWKKFENLTFSKRIHNAYNDLTKKDSPIFTRISNCFTHLTVPKRTIENRIELQKARINEINKNRLRRKNQLLKQKEFYCVFALKYLSEIKATKEQIAVFLSAYNYTEIKEEEPIREIVSQKDRFQKEEVRIPPTSFPERTAKPIKEETNSDITYDEEEVTSFDLEDDYEYDER